MELFELFEEMFQGFSGKQISVLAKAQGLVIGGGSRTQIRREISLSQMIAFMRPFLVGADLRNADLRKACLHQASMQDADLKGADLRGADLREANLKGTDLSGAKVGGADFRGTGIEDFSGMIGIPAYY